MKIGAIKFILVSLVTAAISLSVCAQKEVAAQKEADAYIPNDPARYMGGDARIITAPNGALIYDKAFERVGEIVYTEPTVENLGDNIWIIGGYSIANFVVIETEEGLIVYDTGDYAEEGKHGSGHCF